MEVRQRSVSEVMRTEVVTLAPDETLDLGEDIMRLVRVRHLPVVESEGHLVGIVSNRDLLSASLSKAIDFEPASRRAFLRSVQVREVMTGDVLTVAPDATLEDAAELLLQRQIGCLPVVGSDGTLLGLLSETDLLRAAFFPGLEGGAASEAEGDILEVAAAEVSTWLRGEIDELRRTRDALKVQAHLGRAELRDAWERLERGFQDLEQHGRRIARAAEPSLRDLEADARKLARDLRDGYQRIRDAL